MTISSLLKELKLLCRDLHGLAVLFVMPIAFMLIMSLALSRDQDPHTDSRIALVGVATDSINTALATALEKEQIHVTLMPSEKLTDAQNGLHDKRFQLVLHNPNPTSGKIADDKALQIYVPPDTEPSWLAAVKGVLQQHYTETRLDAYFDNNDGIKIDNKKLPRSIRKDIQKKVDEKNDEQFAAVRSFLDKKNAGRTLSERRQRHSGKTQCRTAQRSRMADFRHVFHYDTAVERHGTGTPNQHHHPLTSRPRLRIRPDCCETCPLFPD